MVNVLIEGLIILRL